MGRVDINRATAISHSDLIGEAAALKRKIQESATEAISRVEALRDDLAPAAFSGDYADLENTPALSAVATSGAYSDLAGTPTLGALASQDTVTHSQVSDWSSATSGFLTASSLTPYAKTADLAAVATSGAYGDLSGKPTLGALASQNSVTTAQVSNWSSATSGFLTASSLTPYAKTADLAAVATSGAYGDLSGRPTVVSAFTNDAGYLTAHQDLTPAEVAVTDVGYVTFDPLKVWRSGNVVNVYIYFTIPATAPTAWTAVATGLPNPMRQLKTCASTWAASYARPVAVSVEADGTMKMIYGKASTKYGLVFSYVTAA